MADPKLRLAIEATSLLNAPGVFDLVSAKLADRAGFPALYVSGYGLVASYLGLPDVGIATYRDMVERIAQIVAQTSTPVIADADTGYGGLVNVRHTVRGYEAAGVSAIQIEDQEFPKACGQMFTRRVISSDDMVKKIRVAVDSRSSADFLIIARTDARGSLGLDEALRRAEAYLAAGADMLFVESPQSIEEMRSIGRLGAPTVINMVNNDRTPRLSAEALSALGFRIAIHPTLGLLAAARAMQRAYADLAQNGATSDQIDLYSFADFGQLMGIDEIIDFENRFS
ncbi:MAG: hypothetical protein RLZZ444_1523 [Pseudomonadota bacterium]|jgi:2-methylisocitrate lyase-like PEP mutase family enzyme